MIILNHRNQQGFSTVCFATYSIISYILFNLIALHQALTSNMLNLTNQKNRMNSNQKSFQFLENSDISNKQQLNQQNLKQTNSEDDCQTDISSLFSSVGIVRMNWYSDKDRNLQTINYGSAFAVTNRILITCTHNIFSERKRQFCSQVIFIPNIDKQKIQNQPMFKSDKNKDPETFYRCLTPKNTFNYQPLQEQLTLIVLQSPLQTRNFIKIGTIEKGQQTKSKKLQMIGYPSQNYYEYSNLNMVSTDRKVLSGNLYEIDHHIIKHTMKTSIGMSGSPILSRNDQGQYMAVGIHTHKGLEKNYNSGLFFNSQIIKQIQSFAAKLTAAFNLSYPIKYIYQAQEQYNQNDQSSMLQMRNLNQSSQSFNTICRQSSIELTCPSRRQNKDYYQQEKSSYDQQEEQSNILLYSLEMPTPIQQEQSKIQMRQIIQQRQSSTPMSQTSSLSTDLSNADESYNYSGNLMASENFNCQSLETDLFKLNIDPIHPFQQKQYDESLQRFMEDLQHIFEVDQLLQVISKFTTLTPEGLKTKPIPAGNDKDVMKHVSLIQKERQVQNKAFCIEYEY